MDTVNRSTTNAAQGNTIDNAAVATTAAAAAAAAAATISGKKKNPIKKLDEYGFIVNIDDKGTIRSEDSFYVSGGAFTPALDTIHTTSNHNRNLRNNNTKQRHGRNLHNHRNSKKQSKHNNNNHNFGRFSPLRKASSNDPNSNNNNNNNNNKFSNRNKHKQNYFDTNNPVITTTTATTAINNNNKNINKYKPTNDNNTTTTTTINVSQRSNKRREIKMKRKLLLRREKKWNQMITEYDTIISSKPKRKKLHSRVRKGIPNSIRGKAWVTLARVDIQMKNMNGVYADLVEQSCTDKFEGIHQALLPFLNYNSNHINNSHHNNHHSNNNDNNNNNSYNYNTTTSSNSDNDNQQYNATGSIIQADPTADIMKETIERDINRTFPRHSMFYDSYSDSDDDDDEDQQQQQQGGGKPINNNGNNIKNNNHNNDDNAELSDESYDKISYSGSLGSTGHGDVGDGGGLSHSLSDPNNYNATQDDPDYFDHDDDDDNIIDNNASDYYIIDGSKSQQNHNNINEESSDSDLCWKTSMKAFKKATAHCPQGLCVDAKKENALVAVSSAVVKDNHNNNGRQTPMIHTPTSTSKKEKKKKDFATEEGGQASLRRVLRAYSLYDPEVGYCQGMNFIAGMFITFVTEEEAFWLLVYVMNAKPCRMRGLFGVGMSEAHQVLYVAENLIAQFNPKLSKHFEKENIHVTMFATQWLLTMFTSSFPFHIVTRVWDCFILEGWKVSYRVMLALLDWATPKLMKLKFEDILNYFKVLPFEVDVDILFTAAFNVPLKKRHIEKYAKEWLRKQELEKLQKQQQKQR